MFSCHFCAGNCQDKMGSFTGLEATLASVDFPKSPAIFFRCLDIREKGQQEWKTQGCKDLEIDRILSLDTLALETRLPCLGISTAAPFFPCIQPRAHRGAISLIAPACFRFCLKAKA